MATPEQKNTITNFFRVSSLESLNSDTDGKRFPNNPGGPVFVSRMAYDIVGSTPPPVDLWHGLWYQGEMACLFGEPNVGKTILAMRIAADIVKRQLPVLYFDFENAEHQLLPRYQEHSFGDKNAPIFQIVTPNYANNELPKSNREWLTYILKRALQNNISVIIIDDITHLFGTGDPGDVRYVLNTLRSWVKQYRLSILVIAHARRRKTFQPISLEHLAGSFECAYSFDSVFSLNRANRYNRRTRGISAYIKQHKSRMGEVIYDDENVITASLRFDNETNSLTLCDLTDGGNERQLLRDFGFQSPDEVLQAVLDYKSKFYTICEISERVGISKSQVGRLLQKHFDDYQPPQPSQGSPIPHITDDPINPYPVSSHTVIEQGGIETLQCDDDILPMRQYDPKTGRTYKYYPDGDYRVQIKADEFINLPLYQPSTESSSDDEQNTAQSAASCATGFVRDSSPAVEENPEPSTESSSDEKPEPSTESPADEKPEPSTESPANNKPASSTEPLADNKPVRADQNVGRSEAEGETPVTEAPSTPSPVGAAEPDDDYDDEYDEDDDKPFDKPWDPCAFEEPVSYDPYYYEYIRTH